MKTSNVLRLTAIFAAAAVLIVAALACGSGDGTDYDAELEHVNDVATNNVVEIEVVKAKFAQLEEQNAALTDRVAQLEEYRQEMTHRVSVLEEIGAAGGGANVANAMPGASASATDGQGTDADPDAELVRAFAECSLKMAGTPDSMLPVLTEQTARQMMQEIEDGATTIQQVQMMHSMMCSS